LALSQALAGEAALDRFLSWTHNPLAKASETVLVFLLAVHLAGGLRVLALEFLGWRRQQKTLVAGAVGFAAFFACLFLLNAV
jgi:fumarate reductase subunit D